MAAISYFIVSYQVTSEVTKGRKEMKVGGMRMCEGADPHNYPHPPIFNIQYNKKLC